MHWQWPGDREIAARRISRASQIELRQSRLHCNFAHERPAQEARRHWPRQGRRRAQILQCQGQEGVRDVDQGEAAGVKWEIGEGKQGF